MKDNLIEVYFGMRYVVPVKQQQKYGCIVNVASVGGIRGVLHQAPHIAGKHAASGTTKNAAFKFGKDGIITNAIAPGAIFIPVW